MVVNNKAQSGNYAVAFMIAVCLVILGIAWAAPINQVTTLAMGNTTGDGTDGMNCSSTADMFLKAGCLTADLGQFFFIASIIALAGVIITARIIFS